MKKLAISVLALLMALIPVLFISTLIGAKASSVDTTLATPAYTDETEISLEGSSIVITGTGATAAGSIVTITNSGTYRALGNLTDGMIVISTTGNVDLTLAGVLITHTTGSAIYGENVDNLNLILASGTNNILIDGASYSDSDMKATLFSNDPINISGSGALKITGNYKHGIASDDNLIISGGFITITSVVKDGLHANDDITQTDGAIIINSASSDGLESEGTLLVSGGTQSLTVTGSGIKSAEAMTITNGTIDIVAGSEGIESKSSMVIDDGEFTINTGNDGLNSETDIIINGGKIYINAADDAIDSNGTMLFNGAVIVALGGASVNGLDCNNVCQPIFTGGTLVATGGVNETPSSSSTQYVGVIGSQPVGSAIHIMDSNGVGVLDFEVSKDYASMIFTSPSLIGNTIYSVQSGGAISAGIDFHGLFTGATYTPGRAWVFFTTTDIVSYPTAVNNIYLPLEQQ